MFFILKELLELRALLLKGNHGTKADSIPSFVYCINIFYTPDTVAGSALKEQCGLRVTALQMPTDKGWGPR